MVRNTSQERRNSSAQRRARIQKFQDVSATGLSLSNSNVATVGTPTVDADDDDGRGGRHGFFSKMRQSKGSSKKMRMKKFNNRGPGPSPNHGLTPQRIYQVGLSTPLSPLPTMTYRGCQHH